MSEAKQIETMSLIQKLAYIRTMADVAAKSKRGYNYSYEDITDILAKVTAGMNKYNVSLVPSIVPGTVQVTKQTIVNTKVDKTGQSRDNTTTEMLVQADMQFQWINNDNTEDTLIVPWFVTGSQADPSQAFGSGLTYCTRYFLTNFFQIAKTTAMDVDEYRSKQKEAEKAEDVSTAKSIIEQFDSILKLYLADHKDQKDEIEKFVSRYVKGANYLVIKDPALAAKLLSDFKNKYINAEK